MRINVVYIRLSIGVFRPEIHWSRRRYRRGIWRNTNWNLKRRKHVVTPR